MYGDVQSYPFEDAGLAMRSELGRRGTPCAPRAPPVLSYVEGPVPSLVEGSTLASRSAVSLSNLFIGRFQPNLGFSSF